MAMAARPMMSLSSKFSSGNAGPAVGASLTPARKRLATVDAERIIAVVDLTIKKLELLAVISQEEFPRTKEELQLFPEGLANVFLSHDDHAERYLDSKEGNSKTDLKNSTRGLLRKILGDARDVPGLLTSAAEVPDGDEGLELLIQSMRSLRKLLFERLLTTVDEERRRQEYLAGLIAREQESNEDIAKLQAQVQAVQDDRNAEVDKRERVIERVVKDLDAYALHGEAVARRVQKDAQKRIDKNNTAASTKIKELTVEINGQKASKDDAEVKEIKGREVELAEKRASNKAKENDLRKRKQRAETNIDRLIDEYDASMMEKQKEIDDINDLYKNEKVQLSELQEQFKKLEVEYDVIMDERRNDRERREQAANELAKMVRGALLIQRFWRSYKACRAAKKAAKKGKGGKKGKKK